MSTTCPRLSTATNHRSSSPEQSPFGLVTVHDPRRRRRRRLVLLAIALVAAAVASVVVVRYVTDDTRRDYLSSGGWPETGQGAYQLGSSTPRASDDERPAPIASLAKVMTAYLVLHDRPLSPGAQGPTLLVTAADVADTEHRRSLDQSLVDVREGERLTERQALMAMLLPSANNVAAMITRYTSDTEAQFVARMNATARALGMHDTTYTDPSGYDQGTVSTAKDQLILARAAGSDPVLARMMATRSYDLPVAGRVENTDTLLGRDGFVGMKTGSDDAAGGCFMFHATRDLRGRVVDLWGVVLGQRGHNLVTAGLYAAKQLADRVTPSPS